MEPGAANRQLQLVRMDDHDRISQASSVATISYFPVVREGNTKVQAFGKRCHSARRDPNCPVVIRGWLNKKDSAGLKLWKRRWFVLSNYCLFYYKDSREESVLGSIPLPSYKILFCTPRECKNRKFTFKVVHQGMRSYFFSADTQEDMLGWVRALSQSASMEPDSTLNRRCSSYQDFTKMGGSSESVDLPRPPSDEEAPYEKHRHISRTLSEPSRLTGGRMGGSHSEPRGRRAVRQRGSRTPSPPESSRRTFGPNLEEDSLSGLNTPPTHAEAMGTGSLTPRGQLGSRPHTPVGRVDIRPHDDLLGVPQTLYYTPASPKLEFKSTPTTPVTERWQSMSKPMPTYGSVHHMSSGRRPLVKSNSTGAHADLLPPLPPSSRATNAPHPPPLPHHHHHHHHHHRNNLSVCVLPPAMVPNPRDTPPMRPLESDADAVLTRLCGCDKLLQSLSVEMAQLQMDKDSVHCALEMSRLQLEDWKNMGPRAHEEALIQKALLQEDLVTVRARMCDVSLEMERVWSQYERMESELSVIRSHLQHICNFGGPQEQSQAQRELWMMEDILSGLKINRDHFRFLLGLQRHHMFQPTAPHPGSPGSPTERLHSRLPMDVEQEPPIRPPLPQELQEGHQGTDHGWTEPPYEGIYSQAVDPEPRRGNSQPDLLNVKPRKDTSESSSKWIPPDTTSQSTKKMRMSGEEQIERMKRNQERLANRKKPQISTASSQSEGSEARDEAPFPLRVTRVVTAVLPSTLVARRVSVEDPPPELNNPLPEQIQPETQQRLAVQAKKMFCKPPRRLLLENPDQMGSTAEMQQEQPTLSTTRPQRDPGATRSSKESRQEASKAEATELSRSSARHQAAVANGGLNLDVMTEERPSALLTPDVDANLCLTPEQREAKLRRVERIRARVIRSAARESASTHSQIPVRGEGKDARKVPPDTARKIKVKSDHESHHGYGSHGDNIRDPAELQHPQASQGASQGGVEMNENGKRSKSQAKIGDKTQHKEQGGRTGAARTKVRRPGSPYHVSALTVYQKEGGKGFTSSKNEAEQRDEEPAAGDNGSGFPSSDLRAKWFLSTSQWQGCIPLQIPGLDSLSNEEASDAREHLAVSEDVADSTEMSSAVSESLEKMKENHSLFYKIACDISISDTDIEKNDGNSNGQTSPRPDVEVGEEQLVITEGVQEEETIKAGMSSDQEKEKSSRCLPSHDLENIPSVDGTIPHPTHEIPDKFAVNMSEIDAHVQEEISQPGCENTKREEDQSENDKEEVQAPPAQSADCDTAVDENKKTTGTDVEAKDSEDRNVDQKRSRKMRKCFSLSEESTEALQERGNVHDAPSGSAYEGRSVTRSASFGKARVTVLRTSL